MQAVPPVAPVTPAPGNVPQDEAGGQGWQGQGSKGGGQVGFLNRHSSKTQPDW